MPLAAAATGCSKKLLAYMTWHGMASAICDLTGLILFLLWNWTLSPWSSQDGCFSLCACVKGCEVCQGEDREEMLAWLLMYCPLEKPAAGTSQGPM